MRRRVLLEPALVAAILALAGCSRAPGGSSAAERPPVVLISIDTLRSDRLPAYGYAKIATPSLDGFARDSVVFERAYSHYPLTLPSHSTIFTGLLPPQHGVRDNKGFFLTDENVTLAERLREAGYRTGAVVSSMVMGRPTGIAQGFEEYDDQIKDEHKRPFPQRNGEESAAIARRWVESVAPKGAFFLFLHVYEPHSPYRPPEPYKSRYKDAYDAEIAYADKIVGDFLDFLKARQLYDRSLIIVLSDHGEGLGDHVEKEHGLFLYRESLQVPFFVKLPRQERRGERLAEPVGLIDVAPTILSFLKLGREELPGVALLGSGGRSADRPLYSETFFTLNKYGWSPLRSVISGSQHYIEAPRPELYDLDADPGERGNLLPARETPQRMLAALSAMEKGHESRRQVSEEEARQFAALGYVGGFEPRRTGGFELRDPKDHIHKVAEVWALIDKIGKDSSLKTERRVAELLESLELRNEPLSRTVAGNLLRGGAPDEAARVLALFTESADPATQVVLGEIATALERFPEAEGLFHRALASDGDNAKALRGMGILLLSAGRAADARPWLQRAVELDPGLPEAWNGLGVVRAQAGDRAGAVEAWRKAVELDPSLRDAWFNLAVLLQKTGDRAGATRALERFLPLAKGRERAEAEALLGRLRRPPPGRSPAP